MESDKKIPYQKERSVFVIDCVLRLAGKSINIASSSPNDYTTITTPTSDALVNEAQLVANSLVNRGIANWGLFPVKDSSEEKST